ncbi:MAG: hypothetical protein ICV83_20970 [Cytophagales bacterium]|nr:hypothetical protein [Cytophagales bacterium]
MKNDFFKLAFPSFSPPPGPVCGELGFWVLFATLHALLGAGLVALLPYRPAAPNREATAAVRRPADRPQGRPDPGKYRSSARVAKPAPPVAPQSAGSDLPARRPLPVLAHFPFVSGCP